MTNDELKAAFLVFVGIVATVLIVWAWPDGGGEEKCYPPVTSGQPESAEEHGLVNPECKEK